MEAKLAVCRGTLQPENPLSLLRANGLVWSSVFKDVDEWYDAHIDRDDVAYVDFGGDQVYFPPPSGININMMPICSTIKSPVDGRFTSGLPDSCAQYWSMVKRCGGLSCGNSITYLTINEGYVPVGQTQRRPGLHIERPGSICKGDGGQLIGKDDPRHYPIVWGGGLFDAERRVPVGGLFVASTVSDTCMVWPCKVVSPEEVTDAHGGIEHMREHIGPGKSLQANHMCWMTDCTPHESLPVTVMPQPPTTTTSTFWSDAWAGWYERNGKAMPPPPPHREGYVYRQFFRLVTGKISVWYSKHNDANPLGVLPDAMISDHDKFAE